MIPETRRTKLRKSGTGTGRRRTDRRDLLSVGFSRSFNTTAQPMTFVNALKMSSKKAAMKADNSPAPLRCDIKMLEDVLPSNDGPSGDDLKTIYIGGLFEITSDSEVGEGCTELAAARLALHHVNNARVIPGYRLDIVYNDTKVRNNNCSS